LGLGKGEVKRREEEIRSLRVVVGFASFRDSFRRLFFFLFVRYSVDFTSVFYHSSALFWNNSCKGIPPSFVEKLYFL